jgi:hypothetical protein
MSRRITGPPMSLDADETWPVPLRDLLEANFPLLRNYEHSRAEWDLRIDTDVIARTTMMSANPYASGREAALDECGAIMREVALIGYHCTRLHDWERGYLSMLPSARRVPHLARDCGRCS